VSRLLEPRPTKVKSVLGKIDVAGQVTSVFVSAQSFILSAIVVFLYVGFLLAERRYVGEKISALFPRVRGR
jgi:predicted PurR-regulated permease PerM